MSETSWNKMSWNSIQRRYPVVFYYNSISGKVPDSPGDELLGWVWASQKKVHEECLESCCFCKKRPGCSTMLYILCCDYSDHRFSIIFIFEIHSYKIQAWWISYSNPNWTCRSLLDRSIGNMQASIMPCCWSSRWCAPCPPQNRLLEVSAVRSRW